MPPTVIVLRIGIARVRITYLNVIPVDDFRKPVKLWQLYWYCYYLIELVPQHVNLEEVR
jgi:hypothetical protein